MAVEGGGKDATVLLRGGARKSVVRRVNAPRVLLLLKGSTIAAIAILAWGTAVLFVADHFVRPTIIGNATALPFLAVLLGILGGVETLGLIGLFVGPVVMTLFVTLWHEEKLFGREQE